MMRRGGHHRERVASVQRHLTVNIQRTCADCSEVSQNRIPPKMPDRVLRSGLLSSEKIHAVSGPPSAESLYIRLVLTADDFGLVDLSPGTLKMKVLPGRDWKPAQIAQCVHELCTVGLIREYEAGGKRLGALTNWNQRRWAKLPKFPLPPWGEEHITGGYVAPRAQEPKPQPVAKPRKARANGETNMPAFDALWQAYPRHQGHAAALKAWAALHPDDALQGRILAAVAIQRSSSDWQRDGGKYVPHLATYLHGRRWEDEVKPARDTDRLVI